MCSTQIFDEDFKLCKFNDLFKDKDFAAAKTKNLRIKQPVPLAPKPADSTFNTDDLMKPLERVSRLAGNGCLCYTKGK